MTTRMATKRQTFALFCITKRDYRNDNLTYDQASDLIKELGDPNYVKKGVVKENLALDIFNKALNAGREAMDDCTPTPMIVEQHANVLNDNSPVIKSWVANGGVCGFCWINFKANTTENRKFLAGLKKAGLVGDENGNAVWNKSYTGGFQYWVSDGGQSLQRKEAFGRAFNKVLTDNGITSYVGSRMD